MLKSADGGASWAFVNIAPIMYLIAPLVINPQDSNMLYAVTSGGIVKSIDGGANWSTLPGSRGLLARFLTVDLMTPSTLYAVAVPGRGIFKSIDGGESWVEMKSPSPKVVALAFAHSGTLYAVNEEGALFRSADQGSTWNQVNA